MHQLQLTLQGIAGLAPRQLKAVARHAHMSRVEEAVAKLQGEMLADFTELCADAQLVDDDDEQQQQQQQQLEQVHADAKADAQHGHTGEEDGGRGSVGGARECQLTSAADFEARFNAEAPLLLFHRLMCTGCSFAELAVWATQDEDEYCTAARAAVRQLLATYHPIVVRHQTFPECAGDQHQRLPLPNWASASLTRVLRVLVRECRVRHSRWY